MAYDRVSYLPTVKRIPDELWDEIRMILPPEKPINTIGRLVVSFFRKVLEGILFVLNWTSSISGWQSLDSISIKAPLGVK